MELCKHVAEIVKEKRLAVPKGLSAIELSKKLNCEEGFIARVESGECSILPKMLSPLCEELNIVPEDMVEAILLDQKERLGEKTKMRKGRMRKKYSVDLSP
jgi:ribosome-binding protein aMBF1 (putative translation factor)